MDIERSRRTELLKIVWEGVPFVLLYCVVSVEHAALSGEDEINDFLKEYPLIFPCEYSKEGWSSISWKKPESASAPLLRGASFRPHPTRPFKAHPELLAEAIQALGS